MAEGFRTILNRAGTGNGARSSAKRIASLLSSHFLSPILSLIAGIWLILDFAFLSITRPFVRALLHLKVLQKVAEWAVGLGPYPSLVLLVVPVILLEPVKPIGFYLIGTHRAVKGIVLIALGELIKLSLIERLYHHNEAKLLTIPWFAKIHGLVTRWYAYLKSLPPYRLAVSAVRRIRLTLLGIGRRLNTAFQFR